MPCRWPITALLLLGAGRAPLSAQALQLDLPLTMPPLIDGRLDDDAWRHASPLEGWVQISPGDNTTPSRRTLVLIASDARALYVGIRAYDDPALIRGRIAPRDEITADDRVELYLDTFGDRRRAYLIGVNPAGVQEDGTYAEETGATDLSVDLVFRSKARITAEGWEAELEIPFNSLRYAAGASTAWTLHARRTIPHLEGEIDSWMPIRREAAGFLAQGGRVVGVAPAHAARRIDLIPSVTTVRTDLRVAGDTAGSEFLATGTPSTEVGGTLVLGLTPDVSLDAAWNPDFAQIEADAPVVTANQRFPIFYREKRPFFLEGSELLATPLDVVHTRAIVDPSAALKINGIRGRTAFSLLGARDEAPGLVDGSGAQMTGAVLRLREQVGDGSTIGIMGTGAWYPDLENRTAGLDAALVGRRTVLIAQLTGTWSRHSFYDPTTDSAPIRDGRGVGYAVTLKHTGRHFGQTLTGRGRSPDYRAQLGFTTQTDLHSWSLENRWESDRHADRTVRAVRAFFTILGQVDWESRIRYGYLWPHAEVDLPLLTTVAFGPYLDHLRLYEEEFGPKRTASQAGAFAGAPSRRTTYRGAAITITTTPHPHWSLEGTVDGSWDAFDYDFGDGPRFPRVSPAALADPSAPLDPGPGTTLDANGALTWRAAPNLRIEGSYTKSRLRRNDTGLLAYDEDLWSFTGIGQFSRVVSVRLRTDYRSSRRNFRPQLLLAWTPSPGTAVYAGYNDDLNADGYSPVTGKYQHGVHRNSRTAYVKLSYLMRAAF